MSENIVYVFDADKFKQRVKDYSKTGLVYYPLKTCSDRKVIETINFLNATGTPTNFEIDSITHMRELILTHGVNPNRIVYNNLSKTENEIEEAMELGVRVFTIDEMRTLKSIKRCTPDTKHFIIRLNLGNFFKNGLDINDFRFGTSFEEFEILVSALSRYRQAVGVSFYAQRGIVEKAGEKDYPSAVIHVIKQIDEYLSQHHIRINFLDIGGGMRIDELNNPQMQKALAAFKQNQNINHIIIEPGTGLVNECFDLMAEIKSVKDRIAPVRELNNERMPIQVVDMAAGIYSGLYDTKLYGKQFSYMLSRDGEEDIQVEPLNNRLKEGYRLIYLCGATSCTMDCIDFYQVPSDVEITRNDKMIIKNVGAYTQELMTRFIGGGNFKTILLSERKKENTRDEKDAR